MGNCVMRKKRYSTNLSHTSESNKSIEYGRQRTERIRVTHPKPSSSSELAQIAGVEHKRNSQKRQLQEYLENHMIFSHHNDKAISEMIDAAELYVIPSNTEIITKGSSGSSFFIVKKGKLDEVFKPMLSKGYIFGDSIINGDSTRLNNVITITRCEIWEISLSKYKYIIKGCNAAMIALISHCMIKLPIFNYLTEIQREYIMNELNQIEIEADQTITIGNEIYILASGRVVGKKEITAPAILDGSYPEFTTLEPVIAFWLDKTIMREIIGDKTKQFIQNSAMRVAIKKSTSLGYLSECEVEEAISTAIQSTYQTDQPIFFNSEGFFVIISGSVALGEVVYGPNSYIDGQNETAIAQEKTKIAYILKKNCEEELHGRINKVLHKKSLAQTLQHLSFFRMIPLTELEKLTGYVKEVNFEAGSVIIQKGDDSDGIFIIRSGTAAVLKNNNTVQRTLGTMQMFGERAIIMNEARSATVVADSDVECWFIEKQSFLNALNDQTVSYLIQRVTLQNDAISLEELHFLKHKGKGKISNLFMVVDNASKTPYALKTVSRELAYAYREHKMLANERDALSRVNHPFIMNMVRTFQDEHRLYFLLELINGTDLFHVLNKERHFSEQRSQFYASCILLMLEEMHDNKVIHRNLKPESIGIDYLGYPKLMGFRTSRVSHAKSTTTIGTPHYMAPEMIYGAPYSSSVDLWSFGVMIYEFMTGVRPFGENLKSPYDIYSQILNEEAQFPDSFDFMARDLVSKLLSKKPHLREDPESLKKHKWFADADWDALIMKCITPEYVPPHKSLLKVIDRALANKTSLMKEIKNAEKTDVWPNTPSRRKPSRSDWSADF